MANSAERRAEMLALTERVHAVGVTDEQAREAIDGYLEAAVFAGVDERGDTFDGRGLSWSPEAQARAFDDVMEFIATNIDQIRAFQEATGHGWLQVGIDFHFTRNRHGAGFWDRGAGDPGVALTEASHAWGESQPYLNNDGELDLA